MNICLVALVLGPAADPSDLAIPTLGAGVFGDATVAFNPQLGSSITFNRVRPVFNPGATFRSSIESQKDAFFWTDVHNEYHPQSAAYFNELFILGNKNSVQPNPENPAEAVVGGMTGDHAAADVVPLGNPDGVVDLADLAEIRENLGWQGDN